MEVLQNAGSFPYDTIAVKIALALGVGLVVGLEREWAQKEVGVRTFAITSLLGMLTSLLALQLVVTALVGVFLLVAFLNIHSLLKDQSLEMTTSAALIVTLALGAFIGQGHYFTAVTSAILVTMLLAWKGELARFADALLPEEIHGAVSLGLLSFVVYPLLPDRFVDPWQLVNPRQAWTMVVAIAGIGFLNYVLLRLYSMRGLYYAALLGGLVNSTAAVVELSASLLCLEERSTDRAVAVILLTNVAMFLRNVVILALFAWSAVPTAFPPLAMMALSSILFAWWRRNTEGMPVQAPRLSSPVSLGRVLKFGGVFLTLAAGGLLAQRYFGSFGLLVVSLLGGLVSSASTTATAAALTSRDQISPELAGIATVLTSTASMLVSIPLVYQQTRRGPLIRRLTITSILIVVLGLAVLELGE